jgi:ferredoxin
MRRHIMKYVVNDNCIGCGACEGTCPEIFFMNDQGLAEAKDIDVPPELEESAKEAKEGCPVSVIEEED